jgi:hypothetical protein
MISQMAGVYQLGSKLSGAELRGAFPRVRGFSLLVWRFSGGHDDAEGLDPEGQNDDPNSSIERASLRGHPRGRIVGFSDKCHRSLL